MKTNTPANAPKIVSFKRHIITRVIGFLSLLIAVSCIVAGFYNVKRNNNIILDRVTFLRNLIAPTAGSMITRFDQRVLQNFTTSLSAERDLVSLYIFDAQGEVFSAYNRDGSAVAALW